MLDVRLPNMAGISYSPELFDLTGAQRYRRGWFGRLILQVEETYPQGNSSKPQPFEPTFTICRRWRDASLADLLALETKPKKRRAVA